MQSGMLRRSRGWMGIGLLLTFCLAPVWFAERPAVIAEEAEKPDASKLEPFPRIPHVEPEKALETFDVHEGFELQLIAAEPLVADPVDIAYDANGLAYVVEMRDYPYPEEKDAEPTEFLGRVRLLRDTDGDGRYDESTIFAEGYNWPTAVICWKGGVFLAAAPDIWYLKDHDGDGKADEKRKVYTGFGRSNVQAIVNNLEWGIDNKIYGAASGNGGEVRLAEEPEANPVSVARRDFRFDPETYEVEAISGGARFGNTFDDWGNRFVCNIRNPVQHVVLPQRYLARNRFLASSTVLHDAAESGDQLPVYSISPAEPWRVERAQRWMAERQTYPRSELIGAGFWTSSSGVTIYRGSAFPKEMYGNVFIGEVAGNLVHRQILERDGGTFRSYRADENTEFVRSRDNWFRPVNFANAPDGTLHILDMYRENIEHPWSIPDDIKARMDLQLGNDRGRIYRLCPTGFVAPAPPRLESADSAQLVRELENPNAWWRETAHRLLFERKDRSVIGPLTEMVRSSDVPAARLLAAWALVGLDALDESLVLRLLADEHPEVRRNGVILAEEHSERTEAIRAAVIKLARDPDGAVRMQVALTLGEFGGEAIVEPLATIALADPGSSWTRTAVVSSSANVAPELAARVLALAGNNQQRETASLVQELCTLVAAEGPPSIDRFLNAWEATRRDSSISLQLAIAAGLARGTQRTGQAYPNVVAQLSEPSQKILAEWQAAARAIAVDDDSPLAARMHAVELLAQQPFEEVAETLRMALDARQPSEVQLAAVRTLQTMPLPDVAELLVTYGRTATPAVRQAIFEALLSREPWTLKLLGAMETGALQPGEANLSQRARLVRSGNAEIAKRAEALFGPGASASRAEIVQKYQEAGRDHRPNLERGAMLFRRECQTCHKLGTEGGDVGPNLASVRHRSSSDILLHVLDPNRDVLPQFVNYRVDLSDGRTTVGIIVAETDNSLTLRTSENREETVLRSEIEELASLGQSIMPEGFEQKLSPEEMFDLIAFLLSDAQGAGEPNAANTPTTTGASAQGN